MGNEEEKQLKQKKKRKDIVNELQVDYKESELLRNFNFEETIGVGSFGKVFKARNIVDGLSYAIKIISKAIIKPEEVGRLRGEAMILASLDHPNIVKLKSVIETPTKLYLVMELVKNGTLRQLIALRKEIERPFQDEEVATILRGILRAVEYLHHKNIVHRDLKPENILIENREDLSSIKIVDFGLSTQFSVASMKMLTQKCGTILYMAPEFTREQQYSKPVDIWSCGIIMFQLLSMGRHPLYRHNDNKSTFVKKLQNPVWKFNEKFSKFAQDFFLKLTKTEASERYSVEQALKHPWITRNFHDDIPFTFFENNYLFQKQLDLVYLTKAMLFLEFVKKFNLDFSKQRDMDYLSTARYLFYIPPEFVKQSGAAKQFSFIGKRSEKSDNKANYLSPWTSEDEINLKDSEADEEGDKNASFMPLPQNNYLEPGQGKHIRARPFSLSLNPDKEEGPKTIKLKIHNEPKHKTIAVIATAESISGQGVKPSFQEQKQARKPPYNEVKKPLQEISSKASFVLRTNSPAKSPVKQSVPKKMHASVINPTHVTRSSANPIEAKDLISPKGNIFSYPNHHRNYNSVAAASLSTKPTSSVNVYDNEWESKIVSNQSIASEEEKKALAKTKFESSSSSPQKKFAKTVGDGPMVRGSEVLATSKVLDPAMSRTGGGKTFNAISTAVRRATRASESLVKVGDSPPGKNGFVSERKPPNYEFHLPSIYETGEAHASYKGKKRNEVLERK